MHDGLAGGVAVGSSCDPGPNNQKFATKLEGLVEILESQVMSEWMEMLSVLDLSLQIEATINNSLHAASLSISSHIGLASKKSCYYAYNDCLNEIRTVLQSSQCIVTGASQRKYNILLAEWEKWQRLGAQDQAEVGMPVLEQFMQGSRAVASLRTWGSRRPSEEIAPIDDLVNALMTSAVSAAFGASVKCIIDDVLDSLTSVSPSELLAMQDAGMVKRREADQRLNNALPLLLGGAKDEEVFASLIHWVTELLEQNGWAIPSEVAWPHSYPAKMAKSCLTVLDSSSLGSDKDRVRLQVQGGV